MAEVVGDAVGVAERVGGRFRGGLRRSCAAGPPGEGFADNTTEEADEAAEVGTVEAAAGALDGESKGVAEAVGVWDPG